MSREVHVRFWERLGGEIPPGDSPKGDILTKTGDVRFAPSVLLPAFPAFGHSIWI